MTVVPRISLALSVAAGVLMAIASAAGAFDANTYARETTFWAVQGRAQDAVNLVVVCPLLFVSAYAAARGSVRAVLIWLGAVIYTVYSYVLYAFCLHFGRFFLVYVATLGLSAFAFGGASLALARADVAQRWGAARRSTGASVFLMVFGVAFTLLWLSEIVPALFAGLPPRSVEEAGLPVNPVHVLDLAFILPGMIATAIASWRRRPMGFVFAVPMLIFSITMGLAVVAMAWLMRAHGVPIEPVLLTLVSAMVLTSAYFAAGMLNAPRENPTA